MLRHQIPDGDLSQIFSRALALLLAEMKRKKFAETVTPRAMQRVKGQPTRHIPAAIKRRVAQRDAGRCRYTSEAGQRCNARGFLEFHHTEPWARSGRHAANQIVLMCRSHNQHEAERVFGRQFMERRRLAPTSTAPGGS